MQRIVRLLRQPLSTAPSRVRQVMKSWHQAFEHGKRFIVQPAQLPTARRHAICLNHARVRAEVNHPDKNPHQP